ncbi:MAG TPA: LLM class flavin-dependent oxidoreductase [Stellaceae bacterium]|jgi:alkanesulfonate monooxygenase SsuD/methylene tetrahydromethanopterin reductase-like flavin-dependent oxidoreductase (luciferase family)
MDFGYFTLSDNNYADNPRSPNEFVSTIAAEAIYAEELGFHSAWIGEHHFSSLGVNSAPELLLTYIAAKTRRIRLAPAVNVLPLHHPIRVAEQWATLDLLSGGRVDFAAGRGYDRREYAPFEVDFETNLEAFAEGLEIVHRLWQTELPISHHGTHYHFDDVWITPRPVQHPLPIYVASFSRPSIDLAARLGIGLVVAAGAATAVHGGLAEVARLYRDGCAACGTTPRRLVTSYFIHFADTPEEERAARERQLRYHQECTSPAFPGDPKTAPENYRYFIKIVERYRTMKAEDFNENAVLIGNSARLVDILKAKVEAAGFDEVILYFNLGLKPHERVKEEMARFMAEVAPAFR